MKQDRDDSPPPVAQRSGGWSSQRFMVLAVLVPVVLEFLSSATGFSSRYDSDEVLEDHEGGVTVVSIYGRRWLNARPQPIAESERDEAGYLLLPSLRRAGADDTMGHTAAEAD